MIFLAKRTSSSAVSARRKKEHSVNRMSLKRKIFVIRILAVILVVCAAFWAKQYNTYLSSYVKNQISYNMNFESAALTAKEVILKYSTFYPQAEN